MANPPRKKGTTEETAIVNAWNTAAGARFVARRMPAGARYDVHVEGGSETVLEVLSTRADYGERLVTLRFSDLLRMWSEDDPVHAPTLHIESKRYARFALHTIFFAKFGR